MIHVTVDGETSVTQAFAVLTGDVERLVDGLAVRLRGEVLDRVDAHTRQARPGDTRKPGALLQSVQMARIPGGWLIDHDLQRAPHAPYVHWGTRPHPIFPRGSNLSEQRVRAGERARGFVGPRRKRHVLRWVSGDRFRFAAWVNHPGYKGDEWLVHAAETAASHVEALLREFR